MIHYMKRAYFTRVFDNIGFKCKIICHLKISAKAGLISRLKPYPSSILCQRFFAFPLVRLVLAVCVLVLLI